MATPRREINYEETWIYRICEKYRHFHVIDKSKRGLSSEILRSENYLELYNPDIVILHLGLSDCAPRYFKKDGAFSKIIGLFPLKIQNFAIYRIVKKYFKRSKRYSDVPIDQFKENFEDYILRSRKIGTDILALLIAPVNDTFIRKSPEIVDLIFQYNNVLINLDKQYSNFTAIQPFPDNKVFLKYIDDHHLDEGAQEYFYRSIDNGLGKFG